MGMVEDLRVMGKRKTLVELGAEYGVNRVTVSRWKKEGINVWDPQAVKAHREGKKKLSLAKVGEIYGLSERGVQRARAKGIDVHDHAQMSIYLAEKQPGTAEEVGGDLNDARKRKIDLECQRLELQIRREEGELIEMEAVNDALLRIGLAVRMAHSKAMDELAPMLEGLSAAKIKAKLIPYFEGLDRELSEGDWIDGED